MICKIHIINIDNILILLKMIIQHYSCNIQKLKVDYYLCKKINIINYIIMFKINFAFNYNII